MRHPQFSVIIVAKLVYTRIKFVTMGKVEFIRIIAKKNKITRDQAANLVDSILDTIADTLATEKEITFRNFGVFEAVEQPARKARNPKTGQSVMIPARRRPVFRPGQPLKDAINR